MAPKNKTKKKVKSSKRPATASKSKKSAKPVKKTVKSATKKAVTTNKKTAKKVTKKAAPKKKTAPKGKTPKVKTTKTAAAKAVGVKAAQKVKQPPIPLSKKIEKRVETSKLPHFQSPTKEMLQLFRTAAKDKRKLLKEKSKLTKAPNFLSKQDKKWKKYNMDLRIHSPAMDSYFFSSAEDACTALVRLAKAKGLDVITVTDLYNLSHLDDLKRIADVEKIRVIPGFEFACRLSTCDDLTFLALFPETYSSVQIDGVMTALGVPAGLAAKINLRIELPLEQIVKIVESHEGVLIPTHIDKTPTRQQVVKILINNFGFHAFDLVYAEDVKFFQEGWPNGEFTFFTFSNSTSLAQIGNRNSSLRMPREGFDGLRDIVQRRTIDNHGVAC